MAYKLQTSGQKVAVPNYCHTGSSNRRKSEVDSQLPLHYNFVSGNFSRSLRRQTIHCFIDHSRH